MGFRGMHRFVGRMVVVGLVASGVAVVASTAPAGAALPCAVTAQRSSTPDGDAAWDPVLSADGSVVVFHSRDDWDGENPDGNEEVFLRAIGVGAIQISPNTTGEDGSEKPAVSGDGNVIVYESDRDLIGSNPDENIELFRYVVDTGTTTQVTNTTPAESQQDWMGSYLPTLDGDGSTVVFETSVAHGSLNTDLGFELMRWDAGTLSTIAADSWDASITTDGAAIVFSSPADHLGRNADGNAEVFVHHGGALRQLTRTTGADVELPRISRNDSHIAFGAEQNLIGTNGDGSFEVFVATCAPVLKCDGRPVTIVLNQNQAFVNPVNGISHVIYGTPGNDNVQGRGGNDTFCGLGGNDTFPGGNGNDRFLGGAGNDSGSGQNGEDFYSGEAGNDTLGGNIGADALNGGTGDDVLNGGAGPQANTRDVCDGGSGNDTAIYCEERRQIP